MNPFLLTSQERLADWKSLRKSLTEPSESEQLRMVAQYWAQAPLLRLAYHPLEFTQWPSPWEMVHEGRWCQWSVAIGMEMTLRLAGWNPARLRLIFAQEDLLTPEIFVLQIDGTQLLNYDHGRVRQEPVSWHHLLITVEFNGKFYTEGST